MSDTSSTPEREAQSQPVDLRTSEETEHGRLARLMKEFEVSRIRAQEWEHRAEPYKRLVRVAERRIEKAERLNKKVERRMEKAQRRLDKVQRCIKAAQREISRIQNSFSEAGNTCTEEDERYIQEAQRCILETQSRNEEAQREISRLQASFSEANNTWRANVTGQAFTNVPNQAIREGADAVLSPEDIQNTRTADDESTSVSD